MIPVIISNDWSLVSTNLLQLNDGGLWGSRLETSMIGVSVEFDSLAQVAIVWRLGFREFFWGQKLSPKSHHTLSDFTFLMANSSCLGSANLCRLLHWLENHRKSPDSWPQFLHPHHISIAKVGQNWQRSSHQAWHYSQSSQPVQRQQIQAVSRCFIIVGAKTRPTRPSHLFIIAAIFIGGLQSALDLKGWHLDRKVQETHGTSRNIFQNLASLRIFCEFPLSTFINVILLVWILPKKNSNLPGVHGRATVQKSGLGIIQVMQVSKTPGRTPGSNPLCNKFKCLTIVQLFYLSLIITI